MVSEVYLYLICKIFIMNSHICFHYTDYRLTAYRKEDFKKMSSNFTRQNVSRVYCAPEVLLRISSNCTATADVYKLEELYKLYKLVKHLFLSCSISRKLEINICLYHPFSSFSIILVEIATRTDLISVSIQGPGTQYFSVLFCI